MQQDAVWTLAALADDRPAGDHVSWNRRGKKTQIDAILSKEGVVEVLLSLATGEDFRARGALRTLGNLITGTDGHTWRVLASPSFLPLLVRLLLLLEESRRRSFPLLSSRLVARLPGSRPTWPPVRRRISRSSSPPASSSSSSRPSTTRIVDFARFSSSLSFRTS